MRFISKLFFRTGMRISLGSICFFSFFSLVFSFLKFIPCFSVNDAHAQQTKIRAGTLICKSKGTVGLIVGSNEKVKCTYKSINGGSVSKYRGTLSRVGLDVGIKGPSEIVWDVLGTSSSLSADTISGDYVGLAADAALGVGGGAQILLGGSQKSVILQPLSVKGQTGLNVSVGVAGLALRKR